jgi:oligopeptide transport system permease protein
MSVFRFLITRPMAALAGAMLALIALASLLAPVLPLPDHLEGELSDQFLRPAPEWRPVPPSFYANQGFCKEARQAVFGNHELWNLMGTDAKGRDLFSRILWGGRVSLMVGIIAALISLVMGVGWGAVAGYAGGRTDQIMMRIVDILYSVPFVILVIYIISLLQEYDTELRGVGISRMLVLYVLVGLVYWLTMARIVRGQVLSLRERDFVTAARALGVSGGRIVFRHLVPNILGVAVVYLTLTIPRAMLFEAFISFLGLGVEPPEVSWGLLAADATGVINPLNIYWWLVVFPGGVLAVTLFSLNLVGDALRDLLDPRVRKEMR